MIGNGSLRNYYWVDVSVYNKFDKFLISWSAFFLHVSVLVHSKWTSPACTSAISMPYNTNKGQNLVAYLILLHNNYSQHCFSRSLCKPDSSCCLFCRYFQLIYQSNIVKKYPDLLFHFICNHVIDITRFTIWICYSLMVLL